MIGGGGQSSSEFTHYLSIDSPVCSIFYRDIKLLAPMANFVR